MPSGRHATISNARGWSSLTPDSSEQRVTVVHDPGGLGYVITDIYAFIAVHADGDEAIPAHSMGNILMPLVGADLTRLQQLRPVAEKVARQSGKQVKLVRFTTRTELDVIDP